MLISMLAWSLLDIILIIVAIVFFIKGINTFSKAKKIDDEEQVTEINKKGSKHIIISVILVPFIIFVSFVISIKFIIGI